MGGFTIYYSPLARLTNHLRVTRAGGYSNMLKQGRYDAARGVTILAPMHHDDAATIREWIVNNFRMLDRDEQRMSRYRKIVLDTWDVRDPTVLYRNWDWLDGRERRARRSGYLSWRRIERPTITDHLRRFSLRALRKLIIE